MISARAIAAAVALAAALAAGAADAQVPQRNFVSGSGSGTDTAAHNIIAAPSITGYRYYITAIQCGRTDAGTSPIRATFNDDGSTVLVIPNAGNGGTNGAIFPAPLTVPRTTAFTFTASSGVSTLYCNAQGYQDN